MICTLHPSFVPMDNAEHEAYLQKGFYNSQETSHEMKEQ